MDNKKIKNVFIYLSIACILLTRLTTGYTQDIKFVYNKDSLLINTNDSSKFSGIYKGYYPGPIKYEIEYKEGKRDGRYIEYNSENKKSLDCQYSENVKHGICKEYYKRHVKWNHLISSELYKYGELVEGHYWDRSGQLKSTYLDSKYNYYEIDTNVFVITLYIEGQYKDWEEWKEESSFVTYHIDKNLLEIRDSIFLNIAKINCNDCWFNNMQINDTVLDSHYVIKSFDIYFTFNDEYGVIHDSRLNISENYIPLAFKKDFIKRDKGWFAICNLIITDQYGIDYEMPMFKYNY